jgi:polysaccharide export outer membrane protein
MLLLRILCLVTLVISASCVSNRKLAYFSNLNSPADYEQNILNRSTPVIQPGDLLSITVNSLSPESNILLNNGVLLPTTGTSLVSNEAARKASEGYLVDQSGAIQFPLLGRVVLSGLTREAATTKLTTELTTTVKKPVVNISYLNFRITVLGEVTKPSSFIVSNEHVTLLEALGLAGDMTAYGRRENVLVIREKGGKRIITRLDLTNKDVFASPYFYLQQNDVVYIEPDKARSLQASSRAVNLPMYISIASVIAIVISSLLLNR